MASYPRRDPRDYALHCADCDYRAGRRETEAAARDAYAAHALETGHRRARAHVYPDPDGDAHADIGRWWVLEDDGASTYWRPDGRRHLPPPPAPVCLVARRSSVGLGWIAYCHAPLSGFDVARIGDGDAPTCGACAHVLQRRAHTRGTGHRAL